MYVTDLENLPEIVRSCREAKMLSVRAASIQIGIPPNTLRGIEGGRDTKLSNAVKVIRWLEADLIVAKAAPKPEPKPMSWRQPICASCFLERNPGRIPTRMVPRPKDVEICVDCGTGTRSGIYIRINPSHAAYPTKVRYPTEHDQRVESQ